MREGTKYFGVPTCPYCKKRVNLIRTWSLKRQGEYCCPRCGGISNIYLSPLIHVAALLAVFSGGAVYFFHKFVLDDISLSILLQVMLPFAAFFLLSLFMVYLAKPVIKKVPKSKMRRRELQRAERESQRRPAEQMFYDDQEYLPMGEYTTGTLPQIRDDSDMKIVPAGPRQEYREDLSRTSVVSVDRSDPREISSHSVSSAREADPLPGRKESAPPMTMAQKIAASRARAPREPAGETVGDRPVRTAGASGGNREKQPVRAERTVVDRSVSSAGVSVENVESQSVRAERKVDDRSVFSAGASVENMESQSVRAERKVDDRSVFSAGASVENMENQPVRAENISSGAKADILSRYDDPEYVQRRLQQLETERGDKK